MLIKKKHIELKQYILEEKTLICVYVIMWVMLYYFNFF